MKGFLLFGLITGVLLVVGFKTARVSCDRVWGSKRDLVWRVFQIGFDAMILWASSYKGSKGVEDLLVTCATRKTTESGLILEVLFSPGFATR